MTSISLSILVLFLVNILQIINYKKIDNNILFSFLSLNIIYFSYLIFFIIYKNIYVSIASNIILILFTLLYLKDIKKEKYSFVTTIFLIINIYLLLRYFI